MEIQIGFGLNNIVFGMNEDEVIRMLGQPNKISYTEREGFVVYYYNAQMIKLNFDEEKDYKLYTIEVFNSTIRIFEEDVISLNKDAIIRILHDNGLKEFEIEDFEFFETIFCERIWTTFRFEFDKLKSIEFSPLYDDFDNIIWPYQINTQPHCY